MTKSRHVSHSRPYFAVGYDARLITDDGRISYNSYWYYDNRTWGDFQRFDEHFHFHTDC